MLIFDISVSNKCQKILTFVQFFLWISSFPPITSSTYSLSVAHTMLYSFGRTLWIHTNSLFLGLAFFFVSAMCDENRRGNRFPGLIIFDVVVLAGNLLLFGSTCPSECNPIDVCAWFRRQLSVEETWPVMPVESSILPYSSTTPLPRRVHQKTKVCRSTKTSHVYGLASVIRFSELFSFVFFLSQPREEGDVAFLFLVRQSPVNA